MCKVYRFSIIIKSDKGLAPLIVDCTHVEETENSYLFLVEEKGTKNVTLVIPIKNVLFIQRIPSKENKDEQKHND
jgi:hypothetical protein